MPASEILKFEISNCTVSQSNLRFRISGFEMQESFNFEISRFQGREKGTTYEIRRDDDSTRHHTVGNRPSGKCAGTRDRRITTNAVQHSEDPGKTPRRIEEEIRRYRRAACSSGSTGPDR